MMKRRRKDSRKIWAPLVVALVVWCFSYVVSNISWSIGGEKTLISKFDFVRQHLWPEELSPADSVVFINVSHDRRLVPCYEHSGGATIPIGNTTIVDRTRLLPLVQYLASDTSYRYVMIDILFDDAATTEADSALFVTLASMPRVVMPRERGMKLADTLLFPKTGRANYQTSLLENDFLKYPYLTDDDASMPLRIYEDLTGRTLRRWGPLYLDGHRLARRSVVLTLDVRADNGITNLGADWLDMPLWEEGPKGNDLLSDPFFNNFADKYVVIGSFGDDDMHSTYAGMVVGPEININAAFSLMHGHHMLSPWVALLLLALFYWFSYKTLNQTALLGGCLQRSRWPAGRALGVLWTWIDYPFWLSVFCIFTYVCFNEIYDILVTSTLFCLLDIGVKALQATKRKGIR